MSRARQIAIAVGLLLTTAVVRPSSAVLIGVVPNGSNSDFVTIDAGTGSATVVGATGYENLQGLAVRSDFTIFAAAGTVSPVDLGAIITINPNTGAGTLIGPPVMNPNGPIHSLTFDSGGTLYAACRFASGQDTADSLCSVDQGTGEITLVVGFKYPGANTLRGIEGIEFSGSTLYAAAGTLRPGGPALFTVDTGSGAATLIGLIRDGSSVQLASNLGGLQFVGSTLYATTAAGRLITIDPATGIYTDVGAHGITGSVTGLGNYNPPPTPTSTPTQTPTATSTSTATATQPPCSVMGPGNVCIPSGGPKTKDCFMEWLARPVPPLKANGLRKNKTFCYEGDEDCDVDPNLTNDSCTFEVQICLNNTDPRLSCTPVDVATFEVKGPNPNKLADVDPTNLSVLETQGSTGFGLTVVRGTMVVASGTSTNTQNLCSPQLPILVPLKITNTMVKKKRTKVLRVKVTSVGGKDTDPLKLECRPSTCGDMVVQSDHEQCDDGNRDDGDGCSHSCKNE